MEGLRVMEAVGRDPRAGQERASPRLAWGRGCSPGQVCEAPVQVHGGGAAAEHGQDALQVQQLQLLTVAAEQNQRRGT